MSFGKTNCRLPITGIALLGLVLALAGVSAAQTPAPAGVVGAITAISGSTLTITTDKGEAVQVELTAGTVLKRVPPGQRDLSTAEAIQPTDLAVGDRASVRLDPSAPADKHVALRLIAMKQSDLAAKQERDRQDWQRRGVGGLVKSVDTSAGAITISSGAGSTAKTVTVHTSKTTILKRYAPHSVRFDQAQPAPLDAVHPGDQLRARGEKSSDGDQLQAEEVVSGSFLNISGTIASVDPAASTLVVKDLASKKQITIHVTADAQMRRLPEMMATILAARLKGGSSAPGPGGFNPGAQAPGAPGAQRGAGGQWSGAGSGAPGGGQGSGGQGGGRWGGQGGPMGDPQQMLNRAPAIQLADLKKGEAVMLVATDGSSEVSAITLLAGVEPLLEAPAASQSLLSNWSMGGGTGGADAAQ